MSGHEKEKFVFITTPSGYKAANSYYLKIEDNQLGYDFPLQDFSKSVKKDGAHKFIHISDSEIGETVGHEEWVGNMREYSNNEDVAFIMHTGDICYKPGLDSHIKLMNSKNMGNTQVFYSIGNHDLVAGNYGEEHFESLYGPVFFSFDVGNVHYIVTPMLGGDHAPSYRKADVYNWLKNDLKYVSKDKSIIMFNHSISDDTKTFKYGISETEYVDLVSHNLKGWFYGHWHVNHIHENKDNKVRSVCTATPLRGGIDHASSAFRVLSVASNGDFTSDFRYSFIENSIKIASIQNGQSPILNNGSVPLSVNVYSSSNPVLDVQYKYYQNGKLIEPAKKLKQKTDFNWYADIDIKKQLAGKYITVEVEARLANGELIKTSEVFEYKVNATPKIAVTKDWTNLLGSTQHIGIVADTLENPLQLSWVNNIESNIFMTSPLIYDNSIFIASIDDNETGKAAVARLDSETGDIIWKTSVGASIRSSIAITDNMLFAQDVHGILYAVDTKTGSIVWTKDLEVGMVPAINDGLIANDGIVYAGTGKSLCALNAKTGELIWKNESWNRGEGCTATLALNNDVLIGHANWGGLYANDARDGKYLWGSGDGELRHRSSSPAMMDGVFYMLSSESLFIIESKSGKILTRKKLGYNVNVTSTPLVTDTEIIFGTSDRGVVALDKETLTEKWNFKTNTAMIFTAPYVGNYAQTVESSPVLVGETVYIGASDGNMYGLNRKTGRLEWKYVVGAPILTSVAASGNSMFVVDFSGNVYGFVSQ